MKSNKQLFIDLAEEMERECGDWQNIQDTQQDKELKKRIIEEAEKIIEKAIISS